MLSTEMLKSCLRFFVEGFVVALKMGNGRPEWRGHTGVRGVVVGTDVMGRAVGHTTTEDVVEGGTETGAVEGTADDIVDGAAPARERVIGLGVLEVDISAVPCAIAGADSDVGKENISTPHCEVIRTTSEKKRERETNSKGSRRYRRTSTYPMLYRATEY